MAPELPSSEMGFTTSPSPNGRKLAGTSKSRSINKLIRFSKGTYVLKRQKLNFLVLCCRQTGKSLAYSLVNHQHGKTSDHSHWYYCCMRVLGHWLLELWKNWQSPLCHNQPVKEKKSMLNLKIWNELGISNFLSFISAICKLCMDLHSTHQPNLTCLCNVTIVDQDERAVTIGD